MSKIVKAGTSCDRCGVKEAVDEQIWMKDDKKLYSYCKMCYEEMDKKKCKDCGGEVIFNQVNGYHCIECGLVQPNQKYPYGVK